MVSLGFSSAFVAGFKSPGTIFTLLSTSEFRVVEGIWDTRIQGWRTEVRVGGATYMGGARQGEAYRGRKRKWGGLLLGILSEASS